jgi:hypothetical protein
MSLFSQKKKRTKTCNFISTNEGNNYGNLMSLSNQGLSGIRMFKNAILYEFILSYFCCMYRTYVIVLLRKFLTWQRLLTPQQYRGVQNNVLTL